MSLHVSLKRLSRHPWLLSSIPLLFWIFFKILNTELQEHVSKGQTGRPLPSRDAMHLFLTEMRDSKPQSHVSKLLSNNKCDQNQFELLFLVTSHPRELIRRQSIRDSWGSPSSLESNLPKWTTRFILGIPSDELLNQQMIVEHRMFGDLIFGDFQEAFYNLSHKIHTGFEWSAKYCPTRYIFKADDDIFVNVRNLFTFLHRHDVPKTSLYAGRVRYKSITMRRGKYAVKESEYVRGVYPRFCSGGGMVFTGDVVKSMVSTFDSTEVFKLDDVYYGMLALEIGVDPLHDDAFHMYDGASFVDGCHYTFQSIATHPVKTRGCMMHHYNNYLFSHKFRIDKDILVICTLYLCVIVIYVRSRLFRSANSLHL